MKRVPARNNTSRAAFRPPKPEEVIKVTIVPETWVIAPVATEEQLKGYAEKGWISREDAEHLDRAWPRNSEGRPFIFKAWIAAVVKKGADLLGIPRERVRFTIVDENGMPVDHVVIQRPPLKYRRAILGPVRSTEYFEYLDSTYEITFRAVAENPADFVRALTAGGKLGFMSRSSQGYGRFRVKVELGGQARAE